jgi:DNA-binding CsgD family transcriptional regulator/tetratricopeptide (TPR) repeat protein
VCAHHDAAGGDPKSRREAARWWRRAAEIAVRRLAVDDAARHRAAAVGALRAAGADPGEMAGALVDLAAAEFLAGRYADCLVHCEAGAAEARAAGRPDLLCAAALVMRGVVYPDASSTLGRLCDDALALDGVPDGTRAQLLAQRAGLWAIGAGRDESARAREDAAEAVRLAGTVGTPQVVLDAVRARHGTLHAPSAAAERLELGQRAIREATATGAVLPAVLAHGWCAGAHVDLGDTQAAEDSVAEMATLARSCGLPLARWHHCRARAALGTLLGRFEEARAANDDARALADAGGDLIARLMSSGLALSLARHRGDARELTDAHLAVVHETGPLNPIGRGALASIAVLQGHPEEATSHYDELRRLAGDPESDGLWGAVLEHIVHLAEVFDDAETATRCVGHLHPFLAAAAGFGTPTAYWVGPAQRDIGRMLRVAGRRDEAEPWLRDGVELAVAVRARPFVVRGRLDLARLLAEAGGSARLAEADQLARSAADEARRLDMPGAASAAEALLRRVGKQRRDADPLSAREREVADLVRQALTNREIAEELVLSERTVESHVRNILAKLGCANRVELIARDRSAGQGAGGPSSSSADSGRTDSHTASPGRERRAATRAAPRRREV